MAGLLRKWNRVHEEMREDSLTTTPKISVIIPVYNVEDYLRPCLDSMIDQTVAAAVNILREYRPELLTEPTAEKEGFQNICRLCVFTRTVFLYNRGNFYFRSQRRPLYAQTIAARPLRAGGFYA